MGGYIINFTVYTLAMSGLIFFAFYVYKRVMNGSILPPKNHDMYIEETVNINPRKSLMIVNTGGERFLIASDVDKTTLISKLSSQTLEKVVMTSKKSPDMSTENDTIISEKTTAIDLEKVNNHIEELQKENSKQEEPQTENEESNNSFEDFITKDSVPSEDSETNENTENEETTPEADEELDRLYGPVHLEVISNKNPNPIRRKHSYMSKSYSQGKTVTIDVDAKQRKAESPIKGIVQKVSNL